MPNLGPGEIILILLIIVLLFGANKLPDLARSVGRSARILRSEVKAIDKDDQEALPADSRVVDDVSVRRAEEQNR